MKPLLSLNPTSPFPWRERSQQGTSTAGWRSAEAATAHPVAANKILGVRAGLIHGVFSAHQWVEVDLADRPKRI
jgi:hypothetical protein